MIDVLLPARHHVRLGSASEPHRECILLGFIVRTIKRNARDVCQKPKTPYLPNCHWERHKEKWSYIKADSNASRLSDLLTFQDVVRQQTKFEDYQECSHLRKFTFPIHFYASNRQEISTDQASEVATAVPGLVRQTARRGDGEITERQGAELDEITERTTVAELLLRAEAPDIVIAHVVPTTIVIVSCNGGLFLLHETELTVSIVIVNRDLKATTFSQSTDGRRKVEIDYREIEYFENILE
ncbi:hypothetical protein WN51_06989 [Melipona quadrifasciata]|uniref:Uncharacterized protein n=1 Tax=Melipona quadrifasciata TaxID=166423 RepID=A0A0N1IT44_9HYME|nr:hypothetical protein WN51_06989 [Melipona quadrifasciata]